MRPNRNYIAEPNRNRNFYLNFTTEPERNRNMISASMAETEPNIRFLPENWLNIPLYRIFGRLLVVDNLFSYNDLAINRDLLHLQAYRNSKELFNYQRIYDDYM